MSHKGLVTVLHGEVPPDAPADEQDVLVEAAEVSAALTDLGYRPACIAVSLDLQSMVERIRTLAPVAVFNLVESLAGRDDLQYLAPAVLESAGIAYTGNNTNAIYCTTNKHVAKQIMGAAGIPTPRWRQCCELAADTVPFRPPYIVKCRSEEASRGISDSSVKTTEAELLTHLRELPRRERSRYIVEQYIPGREFNISIVAGSQGPEVLPPAEMLFVDYPPGKPTIVGFSAKWDNSSFEYHHTVRRFEFEKDDGALLGELRNLALRCWDVFGLSGYARVDVRVDSAGQPWVLEINANPCLSHDGGFVAAAARSGYSYLHVIERIMLATVRNTTCC